MEYGSVGGPDYPSLQYSTTPSESRNFDNPSDIKRLLEAV